ERERRVLLQRLAVGALDAQRLGGLDRVAEPDDLLQLHEEGVDRAPGPGLERLEAARALVVGDGVGRVADVLALAVLERRVAGRAVAGAHGEPVVDLHALLERGEQGEGLESRARLEADAAARSE